MQLTIDLVSAEGYKVGHMNRWVQFFVTGLSYISAI
jgi:hypothetical protein